MEVSKTLDTTDPNPSKNQGGIAIVEPVPYTLKIRGGVAVDSSGKAAGKGALIQTDKAATLAATQDQYLFQPVPNILLDDRGGSQISVRHDGKAPTLRAEMHGNVPCVMESAGFCTEHSAKSRSIGYEKEVSPTLRAGVVPACVYSVENHPADSRVNIDESGKVQTLTSRMGTGGGNVPMVMEPVIYDGANVTSPVNASNPQPGDPCHTLSTDARNYVIEPIPIHDMATRFSGKRGDKQDGKGNGQGIGAPGDPVNTLTAGDRHAVAYTASKASFFTKSEKNLASTLVATDYKDPQLVAYQETAVHYIVRRLTPTECARLQGFTDRWGDIDEKTQLTPEEYEFWLEVRNTHAAINGRVVKDYTEAQMLAWYNKLHTDSAEYKMWGNGIALPPALYCMQGILEALTTDADDWML